MCTLQGRIQEFFISEGGGGGGGWGRHFCSERTVELFLWQITSYRDDHVLPQYVNAGHHWRGKYCFAYFASRGEQIIGGYPKQKYLVE